MIDREKLIMELEDCYRLHSNAGLSLIQPMLLLNTITILKADAERIKKLEAQAAQKNKKGDETFG